MLCCDIYLHNSFFIFSNLFDVLALIHFHYTIPLADFSKDKLWVGPLKFNDHFVKNNKIL